MRLTLRTLLAYLDEVLDPAAAEELSKKIEENENARQLVTRIRDVVRRTRLSAPKLDGKGMGLDPNTVAEYIDNTLAAERMPDFEKVCLESDVHLAEVAAAHQILALVLGEPVEVDQACRQRMYKTIQQPTEAAKPAADKPPARAPRRLPARRRVSKLEVPAYLREGDSNGSLTPYLVLAALILIAGGLFALFGPPRLADRIAGNTRPTTADGTGPTPDETAPDATDENGAAAVGEGTDAEDAAATDEAAASTDDASTDDASTDDNADDLPAESSDTDDSGGPAETDVAGEPAATLDESADDAPGTTDADAVADDAADMPAESVDLQQPDAQPLPAEGEPTEVAATDTVPPAPDDLAVAPGRGPALGRFLSANDVLLRPESNENWERVASGETLYADELLVALPTFHPNFALSNGVSAQILGGTILQLAAEDADGVPGLVLQQGRVVLLAVGQAGSQVRVQAGDVHGKLTFADATATVAIEVRPTLPPGADPAAVAATVAVTLYAVSGEVHWQPADAPDSEQFISPARAELHLPPGEPAAAEFPAWVTAEPLTEVELRAAVAAEEHLRADRSASMALKELLDHRRTEVRGLAVQSLMLLGQFDGFVRLLSDPDQKTAWQTQIDFACAQLARGPELAARLHDSLVRLRMGRADDLYRMLLGYSAQDLSGGGATELVNFLEDPDLDVRITAFCTLHRITGVSLYYRPEYSADRRKPFVQRWRQKLEAGEIVYAQP